MERAFWKLINFEEVSANIHSILCILEMQWTDNLKPVFGTNLTKSLWRWQIPFHHYTRFLNWQKNTVDELKNRILILCKRNVPFQFTVIDHIWYTVYISCKQGQHELLKQHRCFYSSGICYYALRTFPGSLSQTWLKTHQLYRLPPLNILLCLSMFCKLVYLCHIFINL